MISSAFASVIGNVPRLTIQLERQHGRVEKDVGTPSALVCPLETKEVGSIPHLVRKLKEEGWIRGIGLAVGFQDLVRVGLDGVHEEVFEYAR